ncbi:hypothetical protein SAMN06265365_101493 [Tistlia consotensis]|uniref:Uncharacterized protein n=1 Tax=Tistlia consotensis USBA 355 TaxID=560819 RepID=A0A1Y6B4X7_9PROT|nr:DUF6635 family protein [Tistlia consotensis]SME92354.1 hypothetical protein SAMN05428998_101491 [Tistlia consotensis USBA 355]SNR27988.1 hypothetical protein SAMN06265365_101493 [Tistlia consotensis]
MSDTAEPREPGADADFSALPPANLPVDPSLARRAVRRGIARYCAERRQRIDPFVRRTFGLRGALGLHRHAVGWDLLRAPANLLLAVPVLAARGGARVARRRGLEGLAGRLERHPSFLRTAVARELEWRLFADFLELPYAQHDPAQGPDGGPGEGRRSDRDALALAILADPDLAAALDALLKAIGRKADDPEFRAWLTESLRTYVDSRAAAAELTNALLSAGVGALVAKQWTPGALTLGPVLANLVAQQMAIASFPLGAWAGGLWYGLFPAAAPAVATASAVGGVLVLGAAATAFSGLVADPLQARLGLHQRRLRRFVDALEQRLAEEEGRFALRDHYLARLFDLIDLIGAAARFAR